MTSLNQAKSMLVGDVTCVLAKNNRVLTSTKTGIAPVLDLINSGVDLKGYVVADKIVGKAVAMLFNYAGIVQVYAEVLSKPALDYLNSVNIVVSYGTLTENIINRKGDDICPMEQTVKDVTNCVKAVELLNDKVKELKNKKD